MVEMSIARELILNKEVYNTVASFDGKLGKEKAKLKKLSKDLKTISLEKAQLESDKRTLQFKLDLVVANEANVNAKYEVELKATKECLKQVRDQKMDVEASQKHTEESQKLAEEWAFMAETSIATANSN
ncbi:hypothetical protein Adt_05098 [Abeliophyllum distichum]|uniref:Uncharacterized protein n=1 Tax=Abeliophyllum distichum TaxID=126358 RepID=A0ABD1V352_9LAMI